MGCFRAFKGVELGALFIITRGGEILASNPLARQLLSPEERSWLVELAQARGWQQEGSIQRWERPGERGPWLLWFTPMTNGSPTPSFCAVTVCDTNPALQIPDQVLTSLFRLTKAEIRLTHQMLAGRSPLEASREMGVTIHTVRTYLKRLYLKTGVKTQAALVRKLMQCARLPVPPQ